MRLEPRYYVQYSDDKNDWTALITDYTYDSENYEDVKRYMNLHRFSELYKKYKYWRIIEVKYTVMAEVGPDYDYQSIKVYNLENPPKRKYSNRSGNIKENKESYTGF